MKRLSVSLLLFFGTLAYAGESVIYPFQGAPDGALPLAGLVADSSGNLYGTTNLGGSGPCQSSIGAPHGCGTIFELSPDGHGGWSEVILYSFQGGKDGEYPGASLAVDNLGNLYGVTAGGGNPCPPSCGNIFELAKDGTFTVLFTFKGNSHGGVPGTGLTIDSDGRLYGTTAPLASDDGSVFQFASGKIKTLHTFVGGADGVFPMSTPIFGPDGNLYGITESGGTNNAGTLYRLTFNTKWHYKVVYSFPTTSFGGPRDNLAFDATGNLYGVTYGDHVFQLKQSKSGKWSGKSIHKFSPFSQEGDGFNVQGGVAVDESGKVYGVTLGGTAKKGYGDGTVYELVPMGSKWTENIVYAFHGGSDGSGPEGQIVFGPKNALFGVTEGGGSGVCGAAPGTCGTVFEFVP